MIVKNEKFKRAILTALGDEEMRKILDCALFNVKSVNDTIRECNIPHSTAYRKIKWLLNENLLVVDRIEITAEGKKFTLFRSALKTINVKYEHGSVLIEAEESFDIIKKLTEKIFSLE